MRLSARQGVAKAVNELSDGLAEAEGAGDDEEEVEILVDALGRSRDTLVNLLERDVDPNDLVERYESGARVKVNMSRGDSPRDQDAWTIEGKGQSHEEAAREFDALLKEYADRWADDVRGLDPYGGGGE